MRKGTLKTKLAKPSGSSEIDENAEVDSVNGNGAAVVDENADASDANVAAHSDDETDSKAKKSKLGKAGKGKSSAEAAEEDDASKEEEDSGDDFDKVAKKTSKNKRKSTGQAKEAVSKRKKAAADEKANGDSVKDEDDEESKHKKTRVSSSRGAKGKSSKVDYDSNEAVSDNESDYGEDERKKVAAHKKTKGKSPKASKAKAKKVESESEEEYEVDKVVDMKQTGKKREFKIRWKGYTAASDTWEAEEGLSCPEAIKAYLAEHPPAKEKSSPAKRGKNKAEKKEVSEVSDDEDETEYEVEKILEVHNKRDGTHEFLIRWKGFSKKDDTWEPEAHLSCRDLIDKFMQRVETAKNLSEKQLRTLPAHTDRFTLSTQSKSRRLSKRGEGKQRVTYHDDE